MKKNTTIMNIMQVFFSLDEVNEIAELVGYKDTARKFTVYSLLEYLVAASVGEWKSFRSGVDYALDFSLEAVNYSTFSKKASDVPYYVFKKLFGLILEKCNRPTRRILNLSKDLLAIDSTTVTVENPLALGCFPWK